MINTHGLKVEVEMPPALLFPFHKLIDTKPDYKIVKAVAKSMESATYHCLKLTQKILADKFGLSQCVIEEILSSDNEMLEYFTI
jgi:hypothetical protein